MSTFERPSLCCAGTRLATLGVLTWLGFVGAFAITDLSAQEADILGYVSHVQGDWVVAGETVYPYRRIFASDSLHVTQDGVTPSLAIILKSGARIRFLCDVQEDCVTALVPADSVPDRSPLEFAARMMRAGSPWLSAGEPDTVHAISRGDATVREAVVLIDTSILDLAPVFQSASAGRYTIAMRAFDAQPSAAPVALSATLQWEVRTTLPVEANDIAPGLYRVEVSRPAGLFAVTSHALVLVAGAENFAALRDRFSEAVRITDSWRGGVRETELRAFLTNYLRQLALSSGDIGD